MSQLKRILVLAFISILIAGCGLKGELYLPEAQPQLVESPEQNDNSESLTSEDPEIPEQKNETD
jgi:predicted small lipoprotein YifL